MKRSMIGKTVRIKNSNSIYFNEWGTVIDEVVEDDEYFVAIADGQDSIPMFSRDELVIVKSPNR